jgi:hypothetical protein
MKLRIIRSTSNASISLIVVLPNNHDSPRALALQFPGIEWLMQPGPA